MREERLPRLAVTETEEESKKNQRPKVKGEGGQMGQRKPRSKL